MTTQNTSKKSLIATANDRLIYIKTRDTDVLFYNYTDRDDEESKIIKEFNKNLKEMNWNELDAFKEFKISLETKESTINSISKTLSTIENYLISKNWTQEKIAEKRVEILKSLTNDDEFNAWVVLTLDYIRTVYDLYNQNEEFQSFIKEATH